MPIGSRQKFSTLSSPLELSIDNVPIEQVFSVKLLGIFINKLSKKIASGIGEIILKELGAVYQKRGLPFSQVGLPYHPGQL